MSQTYTVALPDLAVDVLAGRAEHYGSRVEHEIVLAVFFALNVHAADNGNLGLTQLFAKAHWRYVRDNRLKGYGQPPSGLVDAGFVEL
jgi:hypothetical protein